MPVTIHPTAIVDPGVTLGPGTRVWHFSHLLAGTVIGGVPRLVFESVLGGRNIEDLVRAGLGRWIYLAAFLLASGHPEYSVDDELT